MVGSTERTSIAVYLVFVIIASILFNFILIIVLSKMKDYSHVFMINLGIGDILTSVFVVPFHVDMLLREKFIHGKELCGISQIFFMLSLPSSVINLTLLTAERYINVRFPYKGKLYITKTTLIVVIVTSWTYSLLVSLFPVMYNPKGSISVVKERCSFEFPRSYSVYQVIANFVVPVLIIVTLNILLFGIARKHALKMRQSGRIPSLLTVGSPNDCSTNRLSKYHTSFVTFGNNIKAAKRLSLLVGVCLLCWLPYIVIVLVNILCNSCHNALATWIGNAINYSGTFLNPIIYGMMNKSVRKRSRKMLKSQIFLSKRPSCSSFCNGNDSENGKMNEDIRLNSL